ncbi:hypothetical protein UNPF46_11440 [Bradyrhizobium sp. UNPF46]|nr:hypothetical protein UNPF46_11440 [Bradyrhizobium sp. UNPF46]
MLEAGRRSSFRGLQLTCPAFRHAPPRPKISGFLSAFFFPMLHEPALCRPALLLVRSETAPKTKMARAMRAIFVSDPVKSEFGCGDRI